MDRIKERKDWIQQLKAEGVKAAHPLDGWVNQKKKELVFQYPHWVDFFVGVGDTIAIGDEQSWMLCQIQSYRKGAFGEILYFTYEILSRHWPQYNTLTDEELIASCEKELLDLISTGGRSFRMSIPVKLREDSDVLYGELIKRFKAKLDEEF